jgi:hypothetical protein
MIEPLKPSPELLEKLAGIVHTAIHQVERGSALDVLCRDDEVIVWMKAMNLVGLMPPAKGSKGA